MIPKTIHYCWFGSKPMNARTIRCLDSWQKELPDFTFRKWSEVDLPADLPFLQRTLEAGQFHFAADYARFWALLHYGGIYLDTDMLVLKDLQPFLQHSFFIGREEPGRISGGIIGAEKEHPAIREMVGFYDHLKPTDPVPLVPEVLTRVLANRKDLAIYPPEFFYPYPFFMAGWPFGPFLSHKAYAVHLWEASWVPAGTLFRDGFLFRGLEKLRPSDFWDAPLTLIWSIVSGLPWFGKRSVQFVKAILRKKHSSKA